MLLTADKGMEYQQNLSAIPVSILVVLARSNRMEQLSLAVPLILETLLRCRLARCAKLRPRIFPMPVNNAQKYRC